MKLVQRQFLQVAAVLALTAASQIAHAQTDRAHLGVIMSCPVGSRADMSARVLFQGVSGALGLALYVENSPSAVGSTGSGTAAGAPVDLQMILVNQSNCDIEFTMPIVE